MAILEDTVYLMKEVYSYVTNFIKSENKDKDGHLVTLAELTRKKRLQDLTGIYANVIVLMEGFQKWWKEADLFKCIPNDHAHKIVMDEIEKHSKILEHEWLPEENKPLKQSISFKSIADSQTNNRNKFRRASTAANRLKRRVSVQEEEDMDDVEKQYHPLEPKIAKLHNALFEIVFSYLHFIKILEKESKKKLPLHLVGEKECNQLLNEFPQSYILENYILEKKFSDFIP